jgi:MFS transporter, DHA1 family, multidrug resistance protein
MTEMNTTAELTHGKPSVQSVRIILILGALTAFAPLATDMYLSSFPSIARDLQSDIGSVQLSLSTFFLGLAVGQLFYGPLIDRLGRRIPLLAGILLFTLASALLMLSPNITSFIGLRFLQAIGGCVGMIVSRAVIHDLFSEMEAARALSLMMVIQGVGPIMAPILGGYVLALGNWQAVFGFLVLFGLLCLLAAWRHLPETLPAAQRQRVPAGQMLRNFGRLLSKRAFIVPTLASSLALATLFAFISGSPFVFMDLYGVSQQHYGWLFGLNALGMVIASQINRLLLRRVSAQALLVAAVLVSVVAGAGLLAVSETRSLLWLMLPLLVCLSCVPLLGANGTAIAMAACDSQAGTASSIVGVLQFGIASLVSALVGILHNGTAYPMTGLIFASSLLAGVVLLFRRRRQAGPGEH